MDTSFQPVGFSRPDSNCEGGEFTPPPNTRHRIKYIDYSAHLEEKEDHSKWIQVGRAGDIIEARDPQEFIPISTNKADQIVLQQTGIYSKKQEEEFKRFTIMKDARGLIPEDVFGAKSGSPRYFTGNSDILIA